MQEAEIMRKLTTMLEKMKKTPSLSQNMQMLETFRNYVRPIDPDFSRKLAGHAERFLEGQSINGYAPYQPEYGVEPVPPIMPFFPETEEEEEEEKIYSAADRIVRYHIPPLHYQQHPGTPPEVNQSTSPEEKSQSPEVKPLHIHPPAPATPTQRKGLPFRKKNRSYSPPPTAITASVTTATTAHHTGNEPEAFSQLRPTG